MLAVNTNHQPLIDWIRGKQPDIVLLVEVTHSWAEDLRQLEPDYPYRRSAPGWASTGLALFSRVPLADAELIAVGEGYEKALAVEAQMRIDGEPLTFIGSHPFSPVSPHQLTCRNQQLAELAKLVRRQRGPVVLMGDLNTSPWSPYFQDLLSASGLRDSRQGFGLQTSWPSFCWPVRIPIDHCLVSPGVAVHTREIGPDIGSDHFPVLVEFSIVPHSAP